MPPTKPHIQTRSDLFHFLGVQMNRSYREVLDQRRLEYESNFVKAYLLEFSWATASQGSFAGGSEADFLSASLAPARLQGLSVTKLVEEGFYLVSWSTSGHPVHLYIDTASDPGRRFWLAYSVAQSVPLDRGLDKIVMRCPSIDRNWLWQALLLKVQAKGEYRGVGIDFDRRPLERQANLEPTNVFKVHMFGKPTEDVFRAIQSNTSIRSRAVLSKVRLKYNEADEYDNGFALCDIWSSGKFSGRGTSLEALNDLVFQTRKVYQEKIAEIEASHIIQYPFAGGKASVTGEPVDFVFDEDLAHDELRALAEVVSNGGLPFRIWGMVSEVHHGFESMAVDIHTGSKLFLQFLPDSLRVYLHCGACGNVVPRLLASLQKCLSVKVTARNQNDQQLL